MTQHWWQESRIRRWAWEAWRYYSWRPGYRLTLTTAETTAYVDMHRQVVVCNPEYPYPPLHLTRHVRGLPGDVREFQMRYLESLIAHEAGHTHHSAPLPGGLLGQLVNTIEDERMERLMVRDFPNLRDLFILAADADAARSVAGNGLGGDVLRGCLLHRFTHHHPVWAYQPDQADAVHWPAVRAILEDAWNAPTFDAVVEASRRILALLNLPEAMPARPDLAAFLDGQGQALEEPQQGGSPPSREAPDPSSPDADEPGEAGQGGSGEDDGSPDPGPESGGERGAGQGREVPQRPRPDPQATPRATVLDLDTLGDARALAAILRPPTAPGHTQPSRDRGRYRYDRAVTGSERPFDLRVGEERPGETHLRLAVDISASMPGKDRIVHARRMAYVVTRAAGLAGVPVLAVAFDHEVHPLVTPGTLPTEGLNAVADLGAAGDTFLSPALRWLWRPQLPGTSVTILISDGALSEPDYASCAALRSRHQGVVVPLLLGARPEMVEAYTRTFGAGVVMEEPGDLTRHVLAFLRARGRTRSV
jgi:Mg-chelatase subunit ChlD